MYLIHGKGLSIFNTQSGKTENTFRFFNQTYSLGSSLFKDSKDRLYISGTNGLAVIQQQTLDNTPQSQTVSFDRLFVYNQEVFPGDSTKILSHILNKTNTLELSYNQNNITIEFSTFILGNSGNSVGSIVANLYNEPSHSMTNKLLSSK